MELLDQIIMLFLCLIVLYTKCQRAIYKMGNQVTNLRTAQQTTQLWIYILANTGQLFFNLFQYAKMKMVLIIFLFLSLVMKLNIFACNIQFLRTYNINNIEKNIQIFSLVSSLRMIVSSWRVNYKRTCHWSSEHSSHTK